MGELRPVPKASYGAGRAGGGNSHPSFPLQSREALTQRVCCAQATLCPRPAQAAPICLNLEKCPLAARSLAGFSDVGAAGQHPKPAGQEQLGCVPHWGCVGLCPAPTCASLGWAGLGGEERRGESTAAHFLGLGPLCPLHLKSVMSKTSSCLTLCKPGKDLTDCCTCTWSVHVHCSLRKSG